MPVDNTVTSRIINAFIAGHSIAKAKKDEADSKLEKAEIFKEQVRQFNEQQKTQKEQFDAQFKAQEGIRKLQALDTMSKITENYYKGIMPPSMTEQAGDTNIAVGAGASKNVSPGRIFGEDLISNETILSEPTLGTFSIPSRETQARSQAELERIRRRPELEDKIALEEVEATKQFILKQQEAAAQQARDRENHLDRLKEIDRQNEGRIEQARARGLAAKDDPLEELVSSAELELYGEPGKPLPYGTKKRAIVGKSPGVRLTGPQQEDLATLNTLEAQAKRIRKILEASQYSYYRGLTPKGTYDEALRRLGVELASVDSDISITLEDMQSLIAHERFGASFTGGEKSKLLSFAPSASINLGPVSAKTRLDNFIREIESSKASLISGAVGRVIPRGEESLPKIDLNEFIIK